MMDRDDFPGGYFGCCGMSRARGHAELCPRAEQGIKLTDPDPGLAAYQSRYRSNERKAA
jgi:hypothetical protein